jgi:SAM-dependent methyltransferase
VEKNRKVLPRVPFHVLNIEKQSLHEAYDLVTCCEVVEHLDDRRIGFANLAKMLRPGGHLLITCPTGRVYPTERHFGHTSHPTLSEIRQHADVLGLEVVEARNWGFPVYRTLKWATNIDPAWALKNFASGRYSWASKTISSALHYLNFLNLPSSFSRGGCQLFVLLRKPSARDSHAPVTQTKRATRDQQRSQIVDGRPTHPESGEMPLPLISGIEPEENHPVQGEN